MLQAKLPLIGSLCLFLLTIVNYTVQQNMIVTAVSATLFLFVAILAIVARQRK